MKEFAFEDVDGYTITIARKWDEPLFPAGGGWRFSASGEWNDRQCFSDQAAALARICLSFI
jgi:hypothetical protein